MNMMVNPDLPEIVRDYLAPLAALPEIAHGLKLGAVVTAITRQGLDKVSSADREKMPFVVRYTDSDGAERRVVARAVIDASGTWTQPNPIGVDGLPVTGEASASGRIDYGIPDVAGARRKDYAGKRVLVIGGGHSAINVALALMELQETSPGTEIFWALRRSGVDRLLGGGLNDQLPERGALGLAAKQAMEKGRLNMLAPFAADSIVSKQRWPDRVGHPRRHAIFADRRADRRRDRLSSGPIVPARAAHRTRSRDRGAADAIAADRPELPLLRDRAAAWRGRTLSSRNRLHHRRLEILRPCADLPDGDRL